MSMPRWIMSRWVIVPLVIAGGKKIQKCASAGFFELVDSLVSRLLVDREGQRTVVTLKEPLSLPGARGN